MRKNPTNSDKIIWDYEQAERHKNKPKRTIPFDQETFDLGKLWFQSGKSLEEAHKEMQNNIHFINGFKHGERLEKISKMNSQHRSR